MNLLCCQVAGGWQDCGGSHEVADRLLLGHTFRLGADGRGRSRRILPSRLWSGISWVHVPAISASFFDLEVRDPKLVARERARSIGRTVGILYLLGTGFGILGVAVTSSISGSSEVLSATASNEAELALGALMVMAMAFVLAVIPVVAYPVLSEVDVLLARGYVLFRSVWEAVTYLMTAAAWLMLIPLSGTGVEAVWGDTLIHLDGVGVVSTLAFLAGAAMFNLVLYRGRLVPRWLSVWGLVAIIPYLVPVVLGLFSDVDVSRTSTTTVLLDLPLGLQEITLAVWLIVKGFTSRRVALQNSSFE